MFSCIAGWFFLVFLGSEVSRVLPPSSKDAAMPLEVVAKATCCRCLAFARIRFTTNALPVPPGASRKKRLPASVSMLVMILLYMLIFSFTNLGSLSMKLVS